MHTGTQVAHTFTASSEQLFGSYQAWLSWFIPALRTLSAALPITSQTPCTVFVFNKGRVLPPLLLLHIQNHVLSSESCSSIVPEFSHLNAILAAAPGVGTALGTEFSSISFRP